MPDNFEEHFLLFLVPYDRTSNGTVSLYKLDPSGNFFIHGPDGRPIAEDPSIAGKPIPVNPIANADAWMQAVRSDIIKISRTKVGRLLLNSIRFHGQIITIRPKDVDSCNSVVGEGDTLSHRDPWKFLSLRIGDRLSIGTGANIFFNPETYKIGGKCETKHLQMGGFHIESDETLLHELVHAFRKVSGKLLENDLSKGLIYYENNEEFNAVLVQGIYASERRKPVRASHFHHFQIDKDLNSSLNFFKSSSEAFHYVEKFCLENPGFTKGFINIDTPFNPINAYYEDRETARQFSRSATANRRDAGLPITKAILDFLKKEFKIH